MSKVIATLCKMPSLAVSGLVLADMKTGVVRLLDMGLPEKIKICTGLVRDNKQIYAVGVTAEEVSYLAVLSADSLEPLRFDRLEGVRDVHSILVRDNKLFVVSTGTDTVLRYEFTQNGVSKNPVVAWQASNEGRDTHHINSITSWNGEVVISAFGPKTGSTWSTAAEGYIYSLTQNRMVAEGIYQPHSLCAAKDELYYCESARGRVCSLSATCLDVGGYVRGLAFPTSNQLVVGTSVARKVSKSTGIVNNPADPGEAVGVCALVACGLNADGSKKLAELSLAAFGSEIYDVFVLDGSDAVNLGQASDSILPEISSTSRHSEDNEQLAQIQALTELQYQVAVLTRELDDAASQTKLKDMELALLQTKQREMEAKIAEQGGALSLLSGQHEILESELGQARYRVYELQASSSWKIMAPLRRLAQWLRRAKSTED